MEHQEAKNNQSEQQEERKNFFLNENSVRSLWDNFKCTNIHIIGVPEGEEKEQETGNPFGKMTENIPNLVKKINMQVQEAQRIPNMVNPKRPTPINIIIKMPKAKYKLENLKSSKRKAISYLLGNPHKTVS